MSENKRRPILYNGEMYSSSITKTSSNIPKSHPVTFTQAQEKILNDISKAKQTLRALPSDSRLPNEIVLCLRMQPEFTAKSYYPDSIFDVNSIKFGLKEVGSRVWRSHGKETATSENENSSYSQGKLYFVRATDDALRKFEGQLEKNEGLQSKSFVKNIRTISSLDLLDTSEQILGIPEDWKEGRLEAIIHPFSLDKGLAITHFIDLLRKAGASAEQIKYKTYGDGVTFVSFVGNRSVIETLSGYNPLRTVHPLTMRELPGLNRNNITIPGPLPPEFTKRSDITVGVIDGGIIKGNAYLDNYIEIEDCVEEPIFPSYSTHGMQVCGTVLYGPLNKFGAKDRLPEPTISVKSFRVLSAATSDPDLYDVIDLIENIVPNNPKISVYNLSLGPKGPILDDSISRFTFACDYLSHKYNVLFCVAVGNDGEFDGYDRIQSPSDMVNGLAVGSYSSVDGEIIRAPYSCIGPGREGNKMKPDFLAFGGCDQNPIHLLAIEENRKLWNSGTSFASPIVASAAGQLIGNSNKTIDAVTARALMTHSVNEKNSKGHRNDFGHGILPEDLNDVVSCSGQSYTLIYKGEIEQGKYAEFIIPWIEEINKGNVSFRWTMAISTQIDAQSPDDYTSGSIELVFYPNKNNYTFRKDKKTKTKNILKDSDEIKALLKDGWVQSTFPVSSSKPAQFNKEDDLRKHNLKWDTIDTRYISKMVKSVSDPVFHLHSMARGSREKPTKIRFSLVVSVEALKASVDLYSSVLAKYKALAPIKINLEAKSVVSVGKK